VRIGAHPYRVIGVFKAKGLAGSSYDQDDVVVVPITTVWAFLLPSSAPRIEQVLIRASSPKQAQAVETEVTQLLMRRHGISNPAQADFQVRSQSQLAATFNRTGTLLGWMLAAITAVSLLMGAIGVTTVMLATVSERVREIGIRRSVGATHLHIFTQFLLEALIMSVAGGLLGVVLGAEAVVWVNRLMPELPPAAVSWQFALIAFISVLLVGLTAGTYPALRAARLRPAVGLRQF
jgi:putative ABC transport system permease protein